jgi:hypothetical protein
MKNLQPRPRQHLDFMLFFHRDLLVVMAADFTGIDG